MVAAVALTGVFGGASTLVVAVFMAVAAGGAGAGVFLRPAIVIVTVFVALVVSGALVFIYAVAIERRRLAMFWLALWPVALAVSLGLLQLEVLLKIPPDRQLLLVMVALVPLVNVPFDWLSIGFTRALLRRGCERDAPSLLWLGLADLGIGIALMILLACSLILALQTVDWISAGPDGHPLIDVPNRLIRLYQAPLAAENWWIYLTLFTTLIPSALNGIIGMCSFATWCASARHRQKLIGKIKRLKPEDASMRWDVSAYLMAPVFVGTLSACLGIWGTYSFILYSASALLNWFLWLAVAFDWMLVFVLGR